MEKITIIVLVILSSASASIIVPQEISTLIDFILKFLPPFKKGTENSRIGFGFAFGNHSDFQTTLQFGPETQKQNELPNVTKRRASKVNKEGKSLKLGPANNSGQN